MKQVREEFADTMLELGLVDETLVVLVGDISHGILQPFAKACPGRYYNIGICEPSMMGMAAGLNKVGLNPVVHTIAPFITERSFEQIKLDFGYQNLSVNIVSVGGAFDYSQLGCSHHCYSDVALFHQLKRSQIFIPGNCSEFNRLFKLAYKDNSINYFRVPEYSVKFELPSDQIIKGKAVKLREGDAATFVAIGSQADNAMEIAKRLEQYGSSVDILYYPTLKPFDEVSLRESILKTKRLVIFEELFDSGGLLEQILKNSWDLEIQKLISFSIKDFVHGYGTYEGLRKKAGLDVDSEYERLQLEMSELFKGSA